MQRKSLLENTFGKLPVLVIWANRGVFRLPNGLMGVDSVILLLDEIGYNYQEDLAKNRHLLQSTPPPDIDKFYSYMRREIWRIGSFIVFALNLELTLERRYKELLDFAIKLQPDSGVLSSDLAQRRKAETKKYKYYRNKVFAHTAFGRPKPGDNLSIQSTSLAYLDATIGGITPNGISIGGLASIVGGKDPPEFESFTFPEMASEFSRHFLEWHEMFSNLCKVLQDSTDDQIKQHIDGVVKITRWVAGDSAS
jgi:hypothetical protein